MSQLAKISADPEVLAEHAKSVERDLRFVLFAVAILGFALVGVIKLAQAHEADLFAQNERLAEVRARVAYLEVQAEPPPPVEPKSEPKPRPSRRAAAVQEGKDG
jgi:hypothetical protein